MALLNNADAIYFGDRHVDRVYLGAQRVWPWTPELLFQNGEQGGFWDFTNPNGLFQDATGTVPVVAFGDPIGMATDLSGNGNHLLQTTVSARPAYTAQGALHDGVDDILRATDAGDWGFLTDGSGGLLGASGSFGGMSTQNFFASTQSNAAVSTGVSVGGYITTSGGGIYLGATARHHGGTIASSNNNPPVSDNELFATIAITDGEQITGYRGPALYGTRVYESALEGENPLSTGTSTTSVRTARRIIAISRVLTESDLALVNAWLMEGVE